MRIVLIGMLACTLPLCSHARETSPNTGRITLNSDIHMHVDVTQTGGGCRAGYTWHPSYGGCRAVSVEQAHESTSCGQGYTGVQTRARERKRYVLQATDQAVFDPWGAWQAWDRSACVAVVRAPGVLRRVIVALTGSELGGYEFRAPTRNAKPFAFFWGSARGTSYASNYGVTLEKASAQLRCAFSVASTSGSGEGTILTSRSWLLGPGESISTGHGYCQLSQNNTQARLMGDCASTSGGDYDGCVRATAEVAIVDVQACAVTVRIGNGWQHREQVYPVCEE